MLYDADGRNISCDKSRGGRHQCDAYYLTVERHIELTRYIWSLQTSNCIGSIAAVYKGVYKASSPLEEKYCATLICTTPCRCYESIFACLLCDTYMRMYPVSRIDEISIPKARVLRRVRESTLRTGRIS